MAMFILHTSLSSLFLIIFCLWRVVSEGTQVRIVHGYNVDPPFKYPWNALLTLNDQPLCSATLIHPGWLLTAGHCTSFNASMVVELHRHNVTRTASEEGAFVRTVTEAHQHPMYASENDDDHDVGLLKLNSQINNVDVVRLDGGGYNEIGSELVVIGWGSVLGVSTLFPEVLQEGQVDILDCRNTDYWPEYRFDFNSQLCAGKQAGDFFVDSCQADSGGPLFYPDTGIQVGLVSTGDRCGIANLPGIYARLADPDVVKWINGIVPDVEWRYNTPQPTPVPTPVSTLVPTEAPPSCWGFCGLFGDGCFCDENCKQNGDCCADYDEACGPRPCLDCDSPNPIGGCGNLIVESCVCDLDIVCCTREWDNFCIELAIDECECQADTPVPTQATPEPTYVPTVFFPAPTAIPTPFPTSAPPTPIGTAAPPVPLPTSVPTQPPPTLPPTAEPTPRETKVPTDAPASCYQQCGESLGACFCDPRCIESGDCCYDYIETCVDIPCYDCNDIHELGGCQNEIVQRCVCEADTTCCQRTWDQFCVDLAVFYCNCEDETVPTPATTGEPAPAQTGKPTIFFTAHPTQSETQPPISPTSSAESPVSPTEEPISPDTIDKEDFCYEQIADNVLVGWSLTKDLRGINFEVSFGVRGAWVGFGFSPDGSMLDADAIMYIPGDNKVEEYDMISYNFFVPQLSVLKESNEDQEIFSTGLIANDTHTTMVFSRRLSTTSDMEISLENPTFVVWAYGISSLLGYHHTNRGGELDSPLSINFADCIPEEVTAAPSIPPTARPTAPPTPTTAPTLPPFTDERTCSIDMGIMRADTDFFHHELEFANVNKECGILFSSILFGAPGERKDCSHGLGEFTDICEFQGGTICSYTFVDPEETDAECADYSIQAYQCYADSCISTGFIQDFCDDFRVVYKDFPCVAVRCSCQPVIIEEPPVPLCLGVCRGRRGDCFCDSECLVNGDCCEDYVATCVPSPEPTFSPTQTPSPRPTNQPTGIPTVNPTTSPTVRPTTKFESMFSCAGKCREYTGFCWCDPTCKNSGDCCDDYVRTCELRAPNPTKSPSLRPTAMPTIPPTRMPTLPVTQLPTKPPSRAPTEIPTLVPATSSPTEFPTETPTAQPTEAPTASPTEAPTIALCNLKIIGNPVISGEYEYQGEYNGRIYFKDYAKILYLFWYLDLSEWVVSTDLIERSAEPPLIIARSRDDVTTPIIADDWRILVGGEQYEDDENIDVQCGCPDSPLYEVSCPSWAGDNQCLENPSFMLLNCRESCQMCGPFDPVESLKGCRGNCDHPEIVGDCYCDIVCVSNDDCCDDYFEICTVSKNANVANK